MKRKLLIIISALVVSACVEEVNLDKAFEKTVTVNCILNADAETQSVDIKYNGDFGEILFERVPDADVVMFLYRDDYYNKENSEKPGVCEINIAKNRSGPTKTVELTWVSRYTKFSDMAL